LAAFAVEKNAGETLETFLDDKIFAGSAVSVITPAASDVTGFPNYLTRYKAALEVERAAVANLKNLS